MISWLSDQRCGQLPFGSCRACGDPVKRRGAKLCATCWWAAHPADEASDRRSSLSRRGGAVSAWQLPLQERNRP